MGCTLALPKAEIALKIYCDYPAEIGSAQIKELFGIKSSSTVTRIKKEVWAAQREHKVKTWSKSAINTKLAYRIWGLDVKELEQILKKKQRLGLTEGGTQ